MPPQALGALLGIGLVADHPVRLACSQLRITTAFFFAICDACAKNSSFAIVSFSFFSSCCFSSCCTLLSTGFTVGVGAFLNHSHQKNESVPLPRESAFFTVDFSTTFPSSPSIGFGTFLIMIGAFFPSSPCGFQKIDM